MLAPGCMAERFDTWLYFPQGSGSPGNENVCRGARLLQGAFSKHKKFHAVLVHEAADKDQENIRRFVSVERNLREAVAMLRKLQPRSLFTLGGDCSVDIASIDVLHQCYGKRLGVLWIDAHTDLNTPEISPSHMFCGMPVRVLLGDAPTAIRAHLESPLSPKQVCYGGIRSIDAGEQEYIKTHAIPALSAAEINAGSYEAFLQWKKSAGIDYLHIHLDLDVLDPEDSISVTYSEPNGIHMQPLARFLDFIYAQTEIVGQTVTEFAPREEHTEEAAKIINLLLPFLQQGI